MDSLLFLIKKHNNKTVGYNDEPPIVSRFG